MIATSVGCSSAQEDHPTQILSRWAAYTAGRFIQGRQRGGGKGKGGRGERGQHINASKISRGVLSNSNLVDLPESICTAMPTLGEGMPDPSLK